jgi:ElaB/YqjD/DUF883 family membrane-anchored ribosome-binding protein
MATTTDKNQRTQDDKSMTDKARDTAGKVADKAKETASNVGEKAKQAGEYARDKADQGVSNVGRGMENLGQTIREKGPHSGMFGSAASGVASTLESTGEYLEEKGLSGMAEDLTNVIRRNPVPAVLISIGIGFMIARLTTPRSY